MKRPYKHLQISERKTLYHRLRQGYAIQEIADQLGYHKTTLYRELRRNSDSLGYRPVVAELSYQLRKQNKSTKLERHPELKKRIIRYLKQGWSPELISGYLKRQAGYPVISHETLYRFIYSPAGMILNLHRYLMKKRRYRYPRVKRRRNMVAKARKKMIDQRPASINERRRFGHWEGDLILFRHTRTNVLTLRERKSRFIIAIKNVSRQAEHTTQALLAYMGRLSTAMKSLTLDNGVEFSYHEKISRKLKAVVYFCKPYKSWQKGAIENANRSLRKQLPRRLEIDKLDQQAIDEIANRWNDRPMKCLEFRTPIEVFYQAFKNLPIQKSSCA